MDPVVMKRQNVCEKWQEVPSQNTNIYHLVLQCSQTFANIKHSIYVFNEHLFDVCEDSYKCICVKNACVWLGLKRRLKSKTEKLREIFLPVKELV